MGHKKPTKRKRRPELAVKNIGERSQHTRNLALHVLAAMRRDPKLSLNRAARLNGTKPETVKKYFPKDFTKAKGKFHVSKSDRHSVILYIIDEHGNNVPTQTHSSKDRQQAGRHKRDLNRYMRGSRNALTPWVDKEIAGVKVLTDPVIIRAIEPQLADFSIYKTFGGGSA